ncbi:uncharacterized protein LOC106180011 [Lingula anatina]|uniref:Uncharacterized protein LOC106180011 n=1 Tax=Lingula anatina TaxID=7574 RepID=A0A1S3KA00_LINAN|nr:uncharacterized protein LOC106180011 [Lingula anatina]|eukprot:XP_013419327.1 uncharacterized protein LOC106180011 [Lingula anatina]
MVHVFAQLLPLKNHISDRVCRLFLVEDVFVDWRQCLGGLVVVAWGDVVNKINLLYTMYNLLVGVDEGCVSGILLSVLSAAHRISQLEFYNNGNKPPSKQHYVNIETVVMEIVNNLFRAKQGEIVTLNDLHNWAKDNVKLRQSVQSLLNNAEDNENINNNSEDLSYLTTNTSTNTSSSTTTHNNCLSFTWSPVSHNPESRVPCSRHKHASCVYEDCLYLFGGREANLPLKDLWRYHIPSNTWESLTCSGDGPSTVEDHTLVAYKGCLYMFGGLFGNFHLVDHETSLWILPLDTLVWRKHALDSAVMMPVSRRGHTAVISHHAMHIYGGFIDLKGTSSELWTFDFDSETWHLCYSTMMTDGGPGARHAHSAVVHDSAMWVYGGLNNLQGKNDFWTWSFNLRKWSRVKCRQGPSELYGHSACKVADAMFVFGGESEGSLKNDLWKFHFSSSTWTKLPTPTLCPAPCSKHTAVIVSSLLFSVANTSKRSCSVPQLQELQEEDKMKDSLPPRPFSSPANISPDRVHHFKNRVSPLVSPLAEGGTNTQCQGHDLSLRDDPDSAKVQGHPQNTYKNFVITREPFSTPNFKVFSESNQDYVPLLRRSRTDSENLSRISSEHLAHDNPSLHRDSLHEGDQSHQNHSIVSKMSADDKGKGYGQGEPLVCHLSQDPGQTNPEKQRSEKFTLPGLVRSGSLESLAQNRNLGIVSETRIDSSEIACHSQQRYLVPESDQDSVDCGPRRPSYGLPVDDMVLEDLEEEYNDEEEEEDFCIRKSIQNIRHSDACTKDLDVHEDHSKDTKAAGPMSIGHIEFQGGSLDQLMKGCDACETEQKQPQKSDSHNSGANHILISKHLNDSNPDNMHSQVADRGRIVSFQDKPELRFSEKRSVPYFDREIKSSSNRLVIMHSNFSKSSVSMPEVSDRNLSQVQGHGCRPNSLNVLQNGQVLGKAIGGHNVDPQWCNSNGEQIVVEKHSGRGLASTVDVTQHNQESVISTNTIQSHTQGTVVLSVAVGVNGYSESHRPERGKLHGRSRTLPQIPVQRVPAEETPVSQQKRKGKVENGKKKVLPQAPSFCMFVLGGRESEIHGFYRTPIAMWRCEIVSGKALPQPLARLINENRVGPAKKTPSTYVN